MIEMTCETDFVAKTDKFIQGVESVLETLHSHGQALQIGQQQMGDADYLAKLCKEIKLNKSLDADVGSQTIEDGIKYIISKTQENCKLTKVYQRQWDPEQGEVLHSYVHNPHKSSDNFALGKIGALVVSKIINNRCSI